MNRIVAALRRTFGIVREHVGTDHLGNKYYSIPKQKTWSGRVVLAKRMMETANPSKYEYMEGSIPIEWDAWIRGRRKEPPTIEELFENQTYREQMKLKAKELEEQELARSLQEYKDGLVTAPVQTVAKGHAAAGTYGKPDFSEEPTSTANIFQPGSWKPNSKK